MSNSKQTIFEERYYDFLESVSGMSHIAGQAERLFNAREYEKLERFMREVDAQLGLEDLYGANIVPSHDIMEREMPDVF